MDKVQLIEYKHYSESKLISLLKVKDSKEFKNIIDELKNKKIICKLNDGKYSFGFVGLCIVNHVMLIINPKHNNNNICNDYDNIIKLLREYSKREKLKTYEEEFLSFNGQQYTNNILGIVMYIVDDFISNGFYKKHQKNVIINGTGRIDWNRTIERNSIMFNQNNQPIYIELDTLRSEIDCDAQITNIHKYIVNKCFKLIHELELNSILGYEYIEIPINDNYDNEFMILNIENELNIEFEDRKINLLKAMLNFINHSSSKNDDISILLFGTKYFNIVWEKINSYLFKNQYNVLSKNIPGFYWKGLLGNWIKDKSNIIPDILRIYERNLIIIDAKYYNVIITEENIKGNPGSYDVLKQYIYQMTFDKQKSKLNIDSIFNILLYPKKIQEKYKHFGFVKFDIFDYDPIMNIYMSDNYVYNRYLNYKPFAEKEIKDFIDYIKDVKLNNKNISENKI